MQDKVSNDLYLFKKSLSVSEKEMQLFFKYIMILDEHQKNMNLIGRSTRNNIWSRHLLDSAQILRLLPKQNNKNFIIDVGTGAGLPGIVLAIFNKNPSF